MYIKQHVEVNPKILMGKPVFKSTCISVEQLLEKLSAGEAEDHILEAHPPITKKDTKPALAFAAQTPTGENFYPIAS